MTLKKVEPGVADEYRFITSRAVDSSAWTLISGNFVVGWNTAPTELILYFESPALPGGQLPSLSVDDVSLKVLSLVP